MNLLITGAFKCTKEQKDKINAMFSVDYHDDEMAQVKNPEKYDAVVCNGLFLYNDIEKFTNLKFIQLTSAGLDRVPLQACNEKGIEVKNARGVYSTPIAEWVVLKILEIYKCSHFFRKNQDNKKWIKNRDLQELAGKEVMIVGFGDIGQNTARRLKSFDVSITAVDVIKPQSDLYDKYCFIDDIKNQLPSADIVVLTLPLTEQTKHMFDKEMFSCFKEGSVLVNISRGAVIKESDLIECAPRFLGIALDVFEGEVLAQDNPLWELENIIITPHNSFVSNNNQQRLFNVVMNNLTEFSKETE